MCVSTHPSGGSQGPRHLNLEPAIAVRRTGHQKLTQRGAVESSLHLQPWHYSESMPLPPWLTTVPAALMLTGAAITQDFTSHADPPTRKSGLNVLFIAVDDLRPELGCYGAQHIHSPNIDRLAAQGVLFRKAYCQQPLCNPSRTSLMTGLRPESVGVFGNHVHFRDRFPDLATLPQHFKTHGYTAIGIGKIYHGVFREGESRSVWDTMGDPPTWSEPAIRFGPRYYFTQEGIAQAKQAFRRDYKVDAPEPDEWTRSLVFGPMTEAPQVPDTQLYDGKVAAVAVNKLRQLKNEHNPFFLAVGFIKPHTPFVAPKIYWDRYGAEQLLEERNPDFPKNTPRIAFHGSGEIRRYTDQPKKGPFTDANRRNLRHGYFACISFIDAQIGKVLDELKRLELTEDTVVMLWGDHGYHLGEQGMWGKITCFENAARVPLIVRLPGAAGNGKVSPALVELVDLYPTLCELADLPLPEHLEGTSFAALLQKPELKWKSAAFTQQPRGGNWDRGGTNRGTSIRTHRYRYTEWRSVAAGTLVAQELYDHRTDPLETNNLAQASNLKQQIEELSAMIQQGWQAARPDSISTTSAP